VFPLNLPRTGWKLPRVNSPRNMIDRARPSRLEATLLSSSRQACSPTRAQPAGVQRGFFSVSVHAMGPTSTANAKVPEPLLVLLQPQ
jgi:hypothetical protein